MSVMEYYQNMLKSSEGVIYLTMMALAILPIAYAMIKCIKYSSLGLAFLFWTTYDKEIVIWYEEVYKKVFWGHYYSDDAMYCFNAGMQSDCGEQCKGEGVL